MRMQKLFLSFTLFTSLFSAACFDASAQVDVPFPIDWQGISDSEFDLRRFLVAPAGKNGFVRPEGEMFVDEKGNRVRMWGANLGGVNPFQSHENADKLADAISRLGINVVRIHGIDSDWGRSVISRDDGTTQTLDKENLDKFDYLFAALKKRGVYTNLNLNVFRKYGPNDGLPNHEYLGLGKWATHFHPRMIELQKKFARQLLTHKNPYTNTEYRNDPAVITVEIVNENSLFEGWVNNKLVGKDDNDTGFWSPLPVVYAEELTKQFNEYLVKNFDAKTIDQFRSEQPGTQAGGSSGDANGEAKPLRLLKREEFAKVSRDRFLADYHFILDTEKRFLETMRALIKDEIGLKSMLVGDADHNDSVDGYPHILNNSSFAYIDGHGYWQHPSYGKSIKIKNTPMVNDPSDSTVVQFARSPMVGKPFVISETQTPYPHLFASEGMPITAAYALLNDWDGVLFHQFGSAPVNGLNRQNKDLFSFSADSLKIAELHAAALMWHRKDIAPAKKMIVRKVSKKSMIDSTIRRQDQWKNRPFFDDRFDRRTPLVHRTRWELASDQTSKSQYDVDTGLIAENAITSDTSELTWRGHASQKGRVTVRTPMSRCHIGFTGSTQANESSRESETLNVEGLENDFAAVMVSSLSDQPISSSKRMLLTIADRASDIGLEFDTDGQTVKDFGTGPIGIRPCRGKIKLTDVDLQKPVAHVLDAVGRRTGKTWPVEKPPDGIVITVGQPPGLVALIEE